MWNQDAVRVLFIGCHCDDIELGCGATIHKHKGCEMDAVVLSWRTIDRKPLKEIATQNLKDLGIKNTYFYDQTPSFITNQQTIWEILRKHQNYDIVFSQEPDDHQDHQALFSVTRRAFKHHTIVTYSSSLLSCPHFVSNYFEVVSAEDIEAKLSALDRYLSVYQDKIYLDKEVIRARLLADGAMAHNKYAEGFSIKRYVAP